MLDGLNKEPLLIQTYLHLSNSTNVPNYSLCVDMYSNAPKSKYNFSSE